MQAVFKRFGTSSWASGPARGTHVTEVERRALAYGLPPVVWPDPFPGNTLLAMRAATYAAEAGVAKGFASWAFREAFAAGQDLSKLENVLGAAGVRGVPTLVMGKGVFFGDDQLEAAADYVARSGG